ncbi:hypothetical protein ACHWQZ_G006362 [Mnemiopsis leidyi]
MKLRLNALNSEILLANLRQMLRSANRSLQTQPLSRQSGFTRPISTAFLFVNRAGSSHISTFGKQDTGRFSNHVRGFSVLFCSVLIITLFDYVFEPEYVFKKKSYAHPFKGFLLLKLDGKTEDISGKFLNRWFLFCIDRESNHRVRKLKLNLLTEVAAILALDACSDAQVVECDGKTVVVPLENSERRYHFQSALLTDRSSLDGITSSTSGISSDNLAVLCGSLEMLSRVREDMISGCHSYDSICTHDNSFFLIDPSGENLKTFTGVLSAELVSKEISELVDSQRGLLSDDL